jgi:hypothetical protein
MKTQTMTEEIIDLEVYAKEGKTPPSGKKYQIRVDNAKVIMEKSNPTGRDILEKAGKYPIERFQLNQRLKGGVIKKIDYNQVVDLTTPGIERFMTVPLDQTEG